MSYFDTLYEFLFIITMIYVHSLYRFQQVASYLSKVANFSYARVLGTFDFIGIS